jgi:diguanylate cyclase (GGDEF)-like protein
MSGYDDYISNGKRHILVADDEFINRELLENILGDEYDVLKAEDGEMAYEMIKQNRNTISLILLDLMMPKLSGLELLTCLKQDSELKGIPVIVLTSDQQSEVESLKKGAADFIPKPYPQPDVIKARISKSIELAEDRQIISATEKDALTGLYTSEYFFRYGEQLDKFYPTCDMDALCIDVDHFHVLNERFGIAKGDEILRSIAQRLNSIFDDSRAILCRKAADTFLVYCPHRDDYEKVAEQASEVSAELSAAIKLRIGVYANCDKKLVIHSRFDRAKLAADKIRNNFSAFLSFFKESMIEKELFAERLVAEFPKALSEK